LLRYLREARMPVAGLVENMAHAGTPADADLGVPALAAKEAVPFLGTLPFDGSLEAATGDPGQLTATPFARYLEPVISGALGSGAGPRS